MNVTDYWNQRAGLGETAGTPDLIAKQLEQRAILDAVRRIVPTVQPSTILEVGCGRGELARRIVSLMPLVTYLAVDNAEAMIAEAQKFPHPSRLRFQVAEVSDLRQGLFDCVVTERMLINLPRWDAQLVAIQAIAARLMPGGYFLMCENSQDGLHAINKARAAVGLPVIVPPWHNRYFEDALLARDVRCLKLVRCKRFSSTYYFLSRIVNAKLAHDAGQAPAYGSPINQLALHLPACGPYAQGRLWVWRKASKKQ
jgi:SAM-dependent methyltransferase